MNKETVVFLMGPTASGKTDAALALSEFFPMEVISVDSALVYRDMNIGTAKPDKTILEKVPHHLIDICDPTESYSAAQFCQDTNTLIPEIFSREKQPFLVGGTMMYFKSLIGGLSKMPGANPEIRAQLDAQAAEEGSEVLYQRLKEVDPETANRLHPNDSQRIQRALETFLSTGKKLNELWAEKENQFPYPYISIALAPADRSVLHQRIAERFDIMLKNGLIDEVKSLMARGDLNLKMPSMRAVGYRQVWQGLLENQSLAEIREKGIAATRQLAKRQLTWLRHWPNIHLFDTTSPNAVKEIRNFLYDL